MSEPTNLSWQAVKLIGRYTSGNKRLVYVFGWQHIDCIDGHCDTDWAGCLRTRKSTSGGAIMLGAHTIRTYSSTQQSISLSSGEAEYYGLAKGAAAALGQQALMSDFV